MTHAMRLNGGTSAENALERGWDLYQHDGYWYVNTAAGDRRPGGEKELGSGPSPDEAMHSAVTEHDRRESERLEAEATARRDAEPARTFENFDNVTGTARPDPFDR